MPRKVVVAGAAGAQGGAILRAFRAAGWEATGLRRAGSPADPDLTPVDVESVAALAAVLAGADALVFSSPIDHRPGVRERLAERLVTAAGRAGVGCVVLNTAAAVPDGLRRPVAEVLRRVRATVMSGPVPSAVIEPTCFNENLSAPWAAPAIVGGLLAYPAPRVARISWISHATLGAFALAATGRAVTGGRVFRIGGPEALTGEEVAARLAAALGRPVRYKEAPLDAFAAAINAASGAPAGDDIADYYRHLFDRPDELARDGAAAAELGVTPESFAAWALRQEWPAPAAPAG